MGSKIDGGASRIGMQLFVKTRLSIANTPFDAGLQAMLGYFDRKEDIYGRDHLLVVNFRIGVEFFNNVGITLEYKLMQKEYSLPDSPVNCNRYASI